MILKEFFEGLVQEYLDTKAKFEKLDYVSFSTTRTFTPLNHEGLKVDFVVRPATNEELERDGAVDS